jgi:D-serine dehydratase
MHAGSLDLTVKGMPPLEQAVWLPEVAGQGWALSDLAPPVMILREEALAHNLDAMARFCRRHGVELAPHGKTTMAPRLWQRQIEAGAWGITAANAVQARIMKWAGVHRVILANEVADRASARWLASALADPWFEIWCLVDSVAGVELIDRWLRTDQAPRPLPVLVEIGHTGGRGGCRTEAAVKEVAEAVSRASHLSLAGVEAFEGTVCSQRTPECLHLVDELLEGVGSSLSALNFDTSSVIVSAGGSAFFDRVVEKLGGRQATLVLRSGCYLTHDSGHYQHLGLDLGLRPALEIWGTVLSIPEPDLAILGFGKRDVSYDLGLPVPFAARRQGEGPSRPIEMEVFRLNDQHAYCRIPDGNPLEVGDWIGAGISHPCTAFDKWRVIPVLDDDDRLIEAIVTYF